MNQNDLDTRFRRWLSRLASQWNLSLGDAAASFGWDEIANRLYEYPRLRTALENHHAEEVFARLRSCWALSGRYDAMRLGDLFKNHVRVAMDVVTVLSRGLASEDDGAARQIDDAIKRLTSVGFRPSQAGLLASVVLTAAHPDLYVDFRAKRWETLAERLGYSPPPSTSSLGEKIVWAGYFAQSLAKTPTFKRFWPSTYALWQLSGICWSARKPRPPVVLPPAPEDALHFVEGKERLRLHIDRERSQALVRRAKEVRYRQDPLLRCDVCGFSFRETYGEIGEGFIEAHHIIPLSRLTVETPRRIEDLALVCSNCHKMLHHGDGDLLTLDALRRLLRHGERNTKAPPATPMSRAAGY